MSFRSTIRFAESKQADNLKIQKLTNEVADLKAQLYKAQEAVLHWTTVASTNLWELEKCRRDLAKVKAEYAQFAKDVEAMDLKSEEMFEAVEKERDELKAKLVEASATFAAAVEAGELRAARDAKVVEALAFVKSQFRHTPGCDFHYNPKRCNCGIYDACTSEVWDAIDESVALLKGAP